MTNFKIKIYGLFIVLFVFVFSYSNKTQAQVNENDANSANVLDTISDDDNENLFDTTTNYQQLYDNLNGQGDWIQVTKGAVLNEMSEQNSDDISYSEEPLDSTDQDYSTTVYVWRPYVVGPYYDWDPYCNGRWEFTYAGWIWISYYDWGWAPYHYGRWWYSGYYGWLWFPGRVWAPNWVCWRHYGNYVGWYPRGPHIWWRNRHGITFHNRTFHSRPQRWTFIDKKNFTGNISKSTIISKTKNIDFIKKTEPISSVSDIEKNNKKYSYTGPNVKSISEATGDPISPKKIKATKNEKPDEVSNNTVNVFKNNNLVKQNKVSDGQQLTQTKPNKYIKGNEVVTNNSKRENPTTVNNGNRNTNVQKSENGNKSNVYANNDFYKAKQKINPKTNENRGSKNNQKVTRNKNNGSNTHRSGTNKSGNTKRSSNNSGNHKINSNNQNHSNNSSNNYNNTSRQNHGGYQQHNSSRNNNSNNGSRNNTSTRSSNSNNNKSGNTNKSGNNRR